MKKNLSEILDKCLEMINSGETVEAVLAEYPEQRDALEPLLRTALSISETPEVKPSPEFVEMSKISLLRVIRQEAKETARKRNKVSGRPSWLTGVMQNAWHSFNVAKKVAIPVAIALVLALTVTLGQFLTSEPTPAAASASTLSILSGSISIQNPGSEEIVEGIDGMQLEVGTKIRTADDSHALLTFFDGSTIKLEPGTYIEIQEASYTNGQSPTIVLKQWLGKTWSRVIKMVDPVSRFEIETPTATAIVRGTLFKTEVEDTGDTTVSTTRGLVSVATDNKEVFISPNYETEVQSGGEPSDPEESAGPVSEVILTINGEVYGSVTDPTGASTGLMPDGQEYNQIPGSQSLSEEAGIQSLLIPDPMDGNYSLVLRSDTPGAISFTVTTLSNGEVISEYNGKLLPLKNKEWLVNIDVNIEDGEITGASIGNIEPLGEKHPEKLVRPESGNDEPAVAVKRNNDKEQNQDKGKEENTPAVTGNPNKGNDNSASSASGTDKNDDVKNNPPRNDAADENKKDDQTPAALKPDNTPPGQEKKDENPSANTGTDEGSKNEPPGQEKKDENPPGNDKKDGVEDTGNKGNNGSNTNNNDVNNNNGSQNQDTPPGQNKDKDSNNQKNNSSGKNGGEGATDNVTVFNNNSQNQDTPPGQNKDKNSNNQKSNSSN